MGEAATERSSRFRLPKRCKEEVSFFKRSKAKSTQQKDKCAVDVFREKIPLLETGSVFKDYDVYRVHTLEKIRV